MDFNKNSKASNISELKSYQFGNFLLTFEASDLLSYLIIFLTNYICC